MRSYPLIAHWVDGEPLDGRRRSWPRSRTAYRRFVVDGVPSPTGVVAVGDAWACTNPSLGRGVSIGLMHAVRAPRPLRDAGARRPDELAQRVARGDARTVEPS